MKRMLAQFGCVSLVFLFLVINPVFSQELNDSLLIYYPFDGNSLDSSGNNYHPILFQASFAEDRNGTDESAVYFNGINDLIILPDTQTLKPPFPLSIAFWVKLDDLTPEHGVFFTNDFYRDAHSGVWLNLSSSQRLGLSYGDGYGFGPYNRKSKQSDMLLEVDRWYHITGVVVNENDLRIYINGIEDNGFQEGGADFLSYVGTGGNIGRKDANHQISAYHFKGFFDEFRYWNRVLEASEVWDLYKRETVFVTDNFMNQSISIYPNPATNKLFISFSESTVNYHVSLIDVTGRIMYQAENVTTIDISTLKAGTYLLKLNFGGREIIKKFVKQ